MHRDRTSLLANASRREAAWWALLWWMAVGAVAVAIQMVDGRTF